MSGGNLSEITKTIASNSNVKKSIAIILFTENVLLYKYYHCTYIHRNYSVFVACCSAFRPYHVQLHDLVNCGVLHDCPTFLSPLILLASPS